MKVNLQKLETGFIELKIKGKQGVGHLVPSSFDIRDIISVMEQVESLLFPGQKKDRPLISYALEEGSVIHRFFTSLQAVIGFNAILLQVGYKNSVDFLEPPSAKAFEAFCQIAKRQNWELTFSTSLSESNTFIIDKHTELSKEDEIWVETEFYFYGIIVDIGGKNKANLHLDTEEFGLLKIDASKELLSSYEDNPLYKAYGIRAQGLQSSFTGEMDSGSLKLKEIMSFEPKYNENYIDHLISKATKSWKDVKDADEWLQNLRRND